MIHLRLLGAVDVQDLERDQALAVARRPMELALLVRLALTQDEGAVTRQSLVRLLWPESDERQARHSLRQLLYRTGKRWEGRVIEREGDELRIVPGSLRCDVHDFRRHLQEGRPAEALELYRGDLLQHVRVDSAQGFERWLDTRRQELRGLALEAALELATRAEECGSTDEAITWMRRVHVLDPWGETGLRRLMTLLHEGGRSTEALETYALAARHLERELGVRPAEATTGLAASIRADRIPEPSDSAATPKAPPPPSRGDPVPSRAPGAPGTRRTESWTLPVLLVLAWVGTAGLLAASGSGTTSTGPPATPARVTVHPFTVHDPDPTSPAESAGLARLLSTRLDGFRGIQVREVGAGRIDEDAGDEWAIRGGVVRAQGRARVDARLYRPDGTHRAAVVVDGDASRVLELVDRLAARLLVALDEGDAPAALTWGAATTTISVPALRHLLEGDDLYRSGNIHEAFRRFGMATLLDSTLAVAHHRRADAARWLDHPGVARTAAEAAERHGAVLPEPARALLANQATRILDGADAALPGARRVAARHPEDPDAWYELGETLVWDEDSWETRSTEARDAFRRVVELDSTHVPALMHLAHLAAWQADGTELDRIRARIERAGPGTPAVWEARALEVAVDGSDRERLALTTRMAALDHESLEAAIRGVAVFARDPSWGIELTHLLDTDRHPTSSRVKAARWRAELGMAQGRFDLARQSLARLSSLDSRAALALQAEIMRRAASTMRGERDGDTLELPPAFEVPERSWTPTYGEGAAVGRGRGH